jgi:hypothetical protein
MDGICRRTHEAPGVRVRVRAPPDHSSGRAPPCGAWPRRTPGCHLPSRVTPQSSAEVGASVHLGPLVSRVGEPLRGASARPHLLYRQSGHDRAQARRRAVAPRSARRKPCAPRDISGGVPATTIGECEMFLTQFSSLPVTWRLYSLEENSSVECERVTYVTYVTHVKGLPYACSNPSRRLLSPL